MNSDEIREVTLSNDEILRLHAASVKAGLPASRSALLQGIEDSADIEILSERRFDADFDVVEVDENRDLESCICQNLPVYLPSLRGGVQNQAPLWRGAPAPSGVSGRPPGHPSHYGRKRDRAAAHFARTS